MTLLRDLISIAEHVQRGDFVLRLAEDLHWPEVVLENYVVTPELGAAGPQVWAEIVVFLFKCFRGARGDNTMKNMSANEPASSTQPPLSSVAQTLASLPGVVAQVAARTLPSAHEPSADSMLAELEQLTLDERVRRQRIVEAEASRFSAPQVRRLRPILKDFILRHRDSSDRAEHVAVGSAIRKYLATMPLDELPEAGFLLESGARSTPSIAVELEVAKMVVRKFTAQLADSPDPAPELATRLFELAETYLSDRLLSRERHGATALNAVLGLALMRSTHFETCLEKIRGLRSRWFVEHLAHRSREISKELSARFPTAAMVDQLANLASLVSVPTDLAS